jgi:hypothetical protein
MLVFWETVQQNGSYHTAGDIHQHQYQKSGDGSQKEDLPVKKICFTKQTTVKNNGAGWQYQPHYYPFLLRVCSWFHIVG